MEQKDLIDLAHNIISGYNPGIDRYTEIAQIPEKDAFKLFAGADIIRDHYFGLEAHLCCICNGKSGRCSEDCSFCSQSAHAHTDAPVYPLMNQTELQAGGIHAAATPINRYSIVTSGKGLPKIEVKTVADALHDLQQLEIGTCASLGILDADDFEILQKAGITRYHHNLETARSHFTSMCTTHSYQDRLDTILAAKNAGLSICSGGVFGIGETDEQVLELALDLKELEIDSVPLNFLIPVTGTKAAQYPTLTPLRCLKIISIFRYVLPDKDILICGGREANLGLLHPLIFYAGASGIMTGNYLTTSGRTLENDLDLLSQLGFTTRKKG